MGRRGLHCVVARVRLEGTARPAALVGGYGRDLDVAVGLVDVIGRPGIGVLGVAARELGVCRDLVEPDLHAGVVLERDHDLRACALDPHRVISGVQLVGLEPVRHAHPVDRQADGALVLVAPGVAVGVAEDVPAEPCPEGLGGARERHAAVVRHPVREQDVRVGVELVLGDVRAVPVPTGGEVAPPAVRPAYAASPELGVKPRAPIAVVQHALDALDGPVPAVPLRRLDGLARVVARLRRVVLRVGAVGHLAVGAHARGAHVPLASVPDALADRQVDGVAGLRLRRPGARPAAECALEGERHRQYERSDARQGPTPPHMPRPSWPPFRLPLGWDVS